MPEAAEAQNKEHVQCHGISDTAGVQSQNIQIHSPFYSGAATLQHPALVCNAALANYNNMTFSVATLNKSWMCYDFGNSIVLPTTAVEFVSNINHVATQSLTIDNAVYLCMPSRIHYPGSADGSVSPSSPVTAPGDAKICHHTSNDSTSTSIEVTDRLGSNNLQTMNTHTACVPAQVTITATGQTFTPVAGDDSWSCYDRKTPSLSAVTNFQHSNAIETGSKATDESKLICSTGPVYSGGTPIRFSAPNGGSGPPLRPFVGASADPIKSKLAPVRPVENSEQTKRDVRKPK